jgi:hypothetical protein
VVHEPAQPEGPTRPVTPPLWQHVLFLCILIPTLFGLTMTIGGAGKIAAERSSTQATAISIWQAATADALFAGERTLSHQRITSTMASLMDPSIAEHLPALGLYRVRIGSHITTVIYRGAAADSTPTRVTTPGTLTSGQYRTERAP